MRIFASCVIAVAALAACNTIKDFKGADRDVEFPTLRLQIPIDESTPSLPNVKSPRRRERAFFDLEFSAGHGHSFTDLNSGENLYVGQFSATGPDRIRSSFTLGLASGMFRLETPLSDFCGFELGGGLAAQRLEMLLESSSNRDEVHKLTVGPAIEAGLWWEPGPDWRFSATYMQVAAGSLYVIPSLFDASRLDAIDLTAEMAISPHASIVAGWRWWDYFQDKLFTDVKLNLSGPTIGFSYRF